MTALLDYSPPSGWLTAGDDAEYHARTDRALAWFAEHKVDGTTVPIAGPVELDPQTREWRITQYVRDDDGGLKARDGEVVTRVLRRAVKSLPPWVVDEVAVRVIADLCRDIDDTVEPVAIEPRRLGTRKGGAPVDLDHLPGTNPSDDFYVEDEPLEHLLAEWDRHASEVHLTASQTEEG